jgi:radical SAM superfamily enzyme YgiQ (UPF0313 family)
MVAGLTPGGVSSTMDGMRIAFVSANREKLPDAVIPLGMLYVMGACPAGHDTVLWDLCFEEDPQATLAAGLAGFRPDVVAIGLRNIQNSDYSGISTNLDYYGGLIATIRANSRAAVVLGGSGFSVMPRELMLKLRPDYGIAGEGEEPFSQLIDALAARSDALGHIGSLHYFRAGELVSQPRTRPFARLDGLPTPDRALLDPRYAEEYAIESIQTKRGCVLKCDYCTYPLIEGAQNRVRDPVRVVDEMLSLGPSIRHVFLVDSVFNLPMRHAKEVCRELIRRGSRLPWTCYANPLGFDEELAGLMAEARCAGMEIGSDSGCDEILKRLRKGFDTKAIRRMHELSLRAGLKDCHTFILGTEGETMEQVHRTLDFIVDLDPYAAIVMVWVDDHEAVDPEYAARRRRFREEIHGILWERRRQYPRWIIPPLGVRFDERLFGYLRRLGLRGPLWQHLHLVDRAPEEAAAV